LDFFEVFVGQIEDDKAQDYASDGGQGVAAAEQDLVDAVQDIPDPAPHQYEADDDSHVLREIGEGDFSFRHRV
jgi:hypothetical protein